MLRCKNGVLSMRPDRGTSLLMRPYTTLISAATLAELLEDSRLVPIDCRFSLADPQQGYRDYQAGHIPNARYADLDRDLAAPASAQSGRHPLPDPAHFTETLRGWGVSKDSQVVVYDDAGGAIAARLWWLLRWMGHERAALLDGGYAAWRAEDRPVTAEIPQPERGSFSGLPAAERAMSTEAVQTALGGDAPFRLVDARDPARFRGEVEPIDPVAGHVPGAVNLPFSSLLDADGRWLSPAALRERWDTVLTGAPDHWAVMCGSGVTACHLALAAEICELPAPRLYVGSWSEWCKDADRGIATSG